jgi:hypothetical protein
MRVRSVMGRWRENECCSGGDEQRNGGGRVRRRGKGMRCCSAGEVGWLGVPSRAESRVIDGGRRMERGEAGGRKLAAGPFAVGRAGVRTLENGRERSRDSL